MTEELKNTNRPIENFRDGAIQVTVWPRQGPNGAFYEIERTRSYKDKNDEWQKTTLISERDMLKARRLEDQAYEAIQRLKTQDRALNNYQRTDGATGQTQDEQTSQSEMDVTVEGDQSLAQQREEAMANAPEPQYTPAPEPSREP